MALERPDSCMLVRVSPLKVGRPNLPEHVHSLNHWPLDDVQTFEKVALVLTYLATVHSMLAKPSTP